MSDSAHENLPIDDEPTREYASAGDGDSLLDYDCDTAHGKSISVPAQIGDYEVIRLLGSGGMGQVFLAEHTRMKRIVALKMLPTERMRDETAVARFYDEVRAASRLMHPNIVTAFDASDEDGIHYLAMEFVDGLTLTELVSREGPMSVGDAASTIRQAAAGLLHAHRAGIVHRDVKPGNLMRASDGTIKVLDLGLARIGGLMPPAEAPPADEKDSNKKRRSRLVGTLPYMSPEQLEDPESADPRSDIYSLGSTLYFLLTARPPFSGDFLEQVYGHRYGEIPDLMHVRDDVDREFATIFRRMMAKSPDERYASLDEVIEDLRDYANQSSTPSWLAEFHQRQSLGDPSTARGSSTHGRTQRVLGLDLGMFYAAAAEVGLDGEVSTATAGGQDQNLFRMAIASDGEEFRYGNDAIQLRDRKPQQVAHCLPMYIGQSFVDREIGGRTCPPEVILALLIRRLIRNSQPGGARPDAVAITVPSSYDQLHRRSLIQAASLAGIRSVRLVDRSLAAAQTLLLEPADNALIDPEHAIDLAGKEHLLFVGLTGQATEVAVIERDGAAMQQLATAGHWLNGTLVWLHRLVDLTAEAFLAQDKYDPRKTLRSAAKLQIACERAMHSMLLAPTVEVRIEIDGKQRAVKIERSDWLERCGPLIRGLRQTIDLACRRDSIGRDKIDGCLILGPLLRLPALRGQVLAGLHSNVPIRTFDRIETARGAAACLASELPGRGDLPMPPQSVSGQSIGIVVEDLEGRRRILPVIPRGTLLPARTNRRLTISSRRSTMTLSLVETSGVEGDDWHSLGRYDFDNDNGSSEVGTARRTRLIGFELDINGLLSIRAQQPGTPETVRLSPLPEPPLSSDAMPGWMEWINDVSR